jgi:hypothetical protein
MFRADRAKDEPLLPFATISARGRNLGHGTMISTVPASVSTVLARWRLSAETIAILARRVVPDTLEVIVKLALDHYLRQLPQQASLAGQL